MTVESAVSPQPRRLATAASCRVSRIYRGVLSTAGGNDPMVENSIFISQLNLYKHHLIVVGMPAIELGHLDGEIALPCYLFWLLCHTGVISESFC